MYTYIDLIPDNPEIIQLGINEKSPMTLLIKTNRNGFSGFGSIYFNLLSLKKMRKDFSDFLNFKIDKFRIDDTDSIDYHILITRKMNFIEISGKIGDYTNVSLDFFVDFLEEEMVDKTEIIKLINQIPID